MRGRAQKILARTRVLHGASQPHELEGVPIGTLRGEGIELEWLPFCKANGYAFVNPPYGAELRKRWAGKIAAEGAAGCEIVSLIPARTDTEWFRTITANAAAVGFVRGRLTFEHPDVPKADPAFFPCALVYHGPRVQRFADAFDPIADVLRWGSGRPIATANRPRVIMPSGAVLDLERPDADAIRWADLAIVLQRIRRFGGMIDALSVADHSVIVCELVPRTGARASRSLRLCFTTRPRPF